MRQHMHGCLIKWTAIVFVLLAGVLYIGKIPYDQMLHDEVRARHQQLIKTAKAMIHDSLLNWVQDSYQLAVISCVQRYSDTPSEKTQKRLERTLIDTSDVYSRYDQIRYIGLDGVERVRVNHAEDGAYAVAQDKLQNKADRYYIEQGKTLSPGQIYLSPLDLNMEHDEVERPLKPTIRLMRKVVSDNGEAAGYLVLNYSAGRLLNRLRTHFPATDHVMLLNEKGYWLLNHQRNNEWGWQLGQPDKILKTQHPALWKRIQAQPSGTTALNGDLYSYARFDISNFSREGYQDD